MINNFTMIVGIAFAFLGGMYVSKHGVKKSTTFWSWVSIGVAAMTCGFCIILGKDGMSQISVAVVPTIIYCIFMLATTATRMILTTTAGAMKFYELDKDRMVQVQKNIAEMKEQ